MILVSSILYYHFTKSSIGTPNALAILATVWTLGLTRHYFHFPTGGEIQTHDTTTPCGMPSFSHTWRCLFENIRTELAGLGGRNSPTPFCHARAFRWSEAEAVNQGANKKSLLIQEGLFW